jgi:hypothetical protein
MSRGVRMLLVFLLLMGVIMLMMDCAKKSMHKKKAPAEGNLPSHGWHQVLPIQGIPIFASGAEPGLLWSA